MPLDSSSSARHQVGEDVSYDAIYSLGFLTHSSALFCLKTLWMPVELNPQDGPGAGGGQS